MKTCNDTNAKAQELIERFRIMIQKEEFWNGEISNFYPRLKKIGHKEIATRMAPELNLHYMPRNHNWAIKRNNADEIARFATLDEVEDMLAPHNMKATANVIAEKLIWAANRKILKDYLMPKMAAHILGSYGGQMARVWLSSFYDIRKAGENHHTCIPRNNHGMHDLLPLSMIIN